jgi:tetratricopeptide (TPR) repeat protein
MASTNQWVEVRSEHFTVVTDSDAKQADQLLDQFERMHWLFGVIFTNPTIDPPQPIVVLAVKNEKAFAALEPAAYLAKNQIHLGGLFLSAADKNYILLRLNAEEEHPYAGVYHEYTHFHLRGGSEWLPLWLNEGMAEFIQNTEIRNKDVLLGEPSVDDILYLRAHALIPLPVLFKVDAQSPYYHEEQKGSVFYAESWALTHYLQITDREKGTHRLVDYETLVNHDVDALTAAEKAFGDLKQLQKELEHYIQIGSYKYFVLSSAAAKIDQSTFKSRILSQADADAYRADVLAYVRRTAEARALTEAVINADPKNALAHETMGFLEFQAGNIVEARKWYRQAVQLDSQSYLAHYYFAMFCMGQPDQDDEIESSLQAAIRLNPRFAPAYDQLAAFYRSRRIHLDEAHRMNVQAIQLEPENMGYRMNAASVLMTMERFADAEAVLRAAMKLARKPGDIAQLESRIDDVVETQKQRAQAIAEANRPAQTETSEVVTVIDAAPKHPTEPGTGPKHVADGVIRDVACSYPSGIEFSVVNPKKSIKVYNNNMYKIDLSVLGFTPQGEMNPCRDFEGMKAHIEFVESSDKSVDGQVMAILLKK